MKLNITEIEHIKNDYEKLLHNYKLNYNNLSNDKNIEISLLKYKIIDINDKLDILNLENSKLQRISSSQQLINNDNEQIDF